VNEERSLRAVLADDHAVVRAGIRQFLEAAGGIQVVAEVDDGLAAVEAVKAHAPDVVVLDIQMPGMTGIEVTRWVRANASRTGVLILSAFDDDPYILAVLQAGATDTCSRPLTPPTSSRRSAHAWRQVALTRSPAK
jgi:DNA-binding NarL/FixJ family response regulator